MCGTMPSVARRGPVGSARMAPWIGLSSPGNRQMSCECYWWAKWQSKLTKLAQGLPGSREWGWGMGFGMGNGQRMLARQNVEVIAGITIQLMDQWN